MHVDDSLLDRLEKLAGLRLEGAERALLADRLRRVLAFCAQLDSLPLEDAAPWSGAAGEGSALGSAAPPSAGDADFVARVLAGAPERDGEHFVAPALRPAADPGGGGRPASRERGDG